MVLVSKGHLAYCHLLKPFPVCVCIVTYTLLLFQTNMSVLFCLPTPGGSPLGEHIFPSSVPTSCSTGPWECWELNMNAFLLRRNGHILNPSGREGARWRIPFYSGGKLPVLIHYWICPLQNCRCFEAQLTEEYLAPGNSAEFKHELEPNIRVLSRNRISIFVQYSCS